MSNLANEPAFPEIHISYQYGERFIEHSPGMTIRTYAAIEAMKAMLSNPNIYISSNFDHSPDTYLNDAAIKQADDLIEKLSK